MSAGKIRYTLLDIVKYTCICTIGSGVLFGPMKMRAASENNVICLNLALFIAYFLIQIIAQGYAELGRMVPEEGGDFLYIEMFFSKIAGLGYTLATIFLVCPGCNAFFIGLLIEVWHAQKYTWLIALVLNIVTAPLGLIPVGMRKKIVSVTTYLQQFALVCIAILLPASLVFRTDCTAIDKISTLEQGSITIGSFFKTLAKIYFYFCGFYEANGLSRSVTGPLYKAYMVSTTFLYLIYVGLVNLFLVIYRNDSRDIDFKAVLSFTGKAAGPIHVIISTCLYLPPLLSNGFLCANNLNYVKATYKLKDYLVYLSLAVGAGLAYLFAFIEIDIVFNILSLILIFSSCLSICGMLVFLKRNPDYQMKLPMAMVIGGIVSGFTLLIVCMVDLIRDLMDRGKD